MNTINEWATRHEIPPAALNELFLALGAMSPDPAVRSDGDGEMLHEVALAGPEVSDSRARRDRLLSTESTTSESAPFNASDSVLESISERTFCICRSERRPKSSNM